MTNEIMRDAPMIFFPGTLCDERIFMPLWRELALDNKAFVPLQWAENLEQMLALSEDRLTYYEQGVHLVGYSMGGYVAALAAIDAFHRGKTGKNHCNIMSLSLISSSGKELAGDELAQRKAVTKLIQNKQYKGMPPHKVQTMLHESNQNNEALIQVVIDMAEDLGGKTLLAQMKATANRKNLLSELSSLPIPIRFIVGEQDNIAIAGEIEQDIAVFKNMSVHVVENAGHMLPIEQAQLLAEIILK